MKKVFILSLLVMILFVNSYSNNTADYNTKSVVEKYKKMSPTQLLEVGDSLFKRNIIDSAMFCYAIVYNDQNVSADSASQQIICKVFNKAAAVYLYHCNYKKALEFVFKALTICENIGYKAYIGYVYNNMGCVYWRIKNHALAHKYYKLAYENSSDNKVLGSVLNNLGVIADDNNNIDSALLLYRQSYKAFNDIKYNEPLSNIGLVYQSLNNVDSAFFYYRLALNNARKSSIKTVEAEILSNMGSFHFDMHKYDSAIYYLNLSNSIAKEYNLFNILSPNYLCLSKIEDEHGNIRNALDYYKQYAMINDSLLNASIYSNINDLKFSYDMDKIDKQIQKLNTEQEIKQKTIMMQRRVHLVMGFALLVVIVFMVMLYRKSKTLNKAYNILVAKNMEVVSSDKINQELKNAYEKRFKKQEEIIEKMKNESSGDDDLIIEQVEIHKYKHSPLNEDSKSKLISDILETMSNYDLICNPDFSLNQLADIVNSNHNYVSQIINETFKCNFRMFINDYRIKEARRMLSDPKYKKYSIKSIANMVGFKSRSTFDTTFKEFTGVTPSFYVCSLGFNKKQTIN